MNICDVAKQSMDITSGIQEIQNLNFDARIEPSNVSEGIERYNPDARIEYHSRNKEEKSYNPDDRIEISDYEKNTDVREATEVKVEEAIKEYLSDLKAKSEFSETIDDKEINKDTFEIQSKDKVAEMREEFDDSKSKLRNEWEVINNKVWPRYEKDVYSADGRLLRKAGDRYDAHHIIPLCLGGKNEAGNITPLDCRLHSDIHSGNGSCTNLVNCLGGNNK